MKHLFLLLSFLPLIACSTGAKNEAVDLDYAKLVKQQTRSTDQYQGLYQTFQADFTLLSTSLRSAIVQKRSEFLQWDGPKAQSERDRAFQEMASTTQFFLRFYTPDNDYDDLNKGNSIWKIYLEQNGKRYEGQVQKMPGKPAETMAFFPHFNRFSTAYEVTFNLPTATAENSPCKVTITSSIGNATFNF